MNAAIEFQHLTMRFQRPRTEPRIAVNNLNFTIKSGQIFGLLGPNGSGKTTVVNLICGLLKPTAGQVLVHGISAVQHVARVRSMLGVVPQETALYNDLSAYENLRFHARFYGVPARAHQTRIAEMLDLVKLTERQHDRVSTYSGGMQRRLALARALLTHPKVVILDEPTLGVDVQSRAAVWERIRELAAAGTTVLLTTNYMEEADLLADHLAIIDHGQLIASGTPAVLKKQLGKSFVEIDADLMPEHLETLWKMPQVLSWKWHQSRLRLIAADSNHLMAEVLKYLNEAGVQLQTIGICQPDLNDVFLDITGRALRD